MFAFLVYVAAAFDAVGIAATIVSVFVKDEVVVEDGHVVEDATHTTFGGGELVAEHFFEDFLGDAMGEPVAAVGYAESVGEFGHF